MVQIFLARRRMPSAILAEAAATRRNRRRETCSRHLHTQTCECLQNKATTAMFVYSVRPVFQARWQPIRNRSNRVNERAERLNASFVMATLTMRRSRGRLASPCYNISSAFYGWMDALPETPSQPSLVAYTWVGVLTLSGRNHFFKMDGNTMTSILASLGMKALFNTNAALIIPMRAVYLEQRR